MTTSPRYKFDHSAVQRDCGLYAVDVLDPATGRVVEGDYIGETGRKPFTRFLEHLYDQPFGDCIVGPARLLAVYESKAEVLDAERDAVQNRSPRPRLNHEWNLDNPHRIPVWKQRADRAARDAARGVVSRWTLDGKENPDFPGAAPRPVARRVPRQPLLPQQSSHRARPSRLSAKWQRRRNTAALAAVLWLAGTVAAWWLLVEHFDLGWQVDARTAAVAALLPHCGWLAWDGPNKRWRHAGRWAGLVVAIAALIMSGALDAGGVS